MNDEKLEQILRSIGVQHVPSDAARIAEQTTESFIAALRFIHAQQQVQSPFIVGLKRIAAAAVILIVFSIGLTVGRLSKPQSHAVSHIDYRITYPRVSASQKHEGFWQQKAIAALKPRPYADRPAMKTELINAYKQYLKEKHND